MDNEEKDLWHAYLQQGNHGMATHYANTQVCATLFTWRLWCCRHLYDCVSARVLFAVVTIRAVKQGLMMHQKSG